MFRDILVCYHQNKSIMTPQVNNLPLFDDDKHICTSRNFIKNINDCISLKLRSTWFFKKFFARVRLKKNQVSSPWIYANNNMFNINLINHIYPHQNIHNIHNIYLHQNIHNINEMKVSIINQTFLPLCHYQKD